MPFALKSSKHSTFFDWLGQGEFQEEKIGPTMEHTPASVLAGNEPFSQKTYKIEKDS